MSREEFDQKENIPGKSLEKEELIFDIRKDPYNHMMKMVFSRWKPFLLHAMSFDDGQLTHFSRFTRQLPITQKVLTENLHQLEDDGLIFRTVLDTTPPQVEYRLTEKGKKLIPILDEVYRFGWEDMKEKGMPIDALGEMWHGLRPKDPERMESPYKTTYKK